MEMDDDVTLELPTQSQKAIGVRKGKKDMQSQSKGIIGNVFKFFSDLAENPQERENIKFSQVMKLTAQACGVSEKTVQRIKHTLNSAGDATEAFKKPRSFYKRISKKTDLDDFDKQVVRRTVLEYYDRGEFPTADKIRTDLEEKINFDGSNASVKRILKSLGFKFRRANDGRKFLMEHSDIAASRAVFLRKMHNFRLNDSRPVVYLDETWISQNHTKNFIWQDSDKNGGLKVPTGKGGRLIIAHAGSVSNGFIPDAKLIFRGGKKSQDRDYHTEINGDLFREWFVNLLQSLEEGCIIVMDNASYHSMLKEKIPTSNWKKGDIINWLKQKNIHHDPLVTKCELLSMNEIKTAKKTYELDHIANEMGHEVVRLPPYHCQYNPAELIWAQVKREVALKNNTFKLIDAEKLANEAVDNVTKEDWIKCVRHAENVQEADFESQCARDVIIDPIIVNLRDDTTDDSEDDDDCDIRAEDVI